MASTLPRLPLFEAIKKHDAQSTAIVHSLSGRTFTYGELVNDVAAAKDKLQRNAGGKGAAGQRISFLVENGYDYVGAHSNGPPLRPLGRKHELTSSQ
jgi:malonyl-CoA/methylmalonyl-CoA synthetase